MIADVAGKSIPAALFMALSRTIVRANAAHQAQTAEVLREANNMIAQDASAGMFVTLFYGILDGKGPYSDICQCRAPSSAGVQDRGLQVH